MKSRRSLLHLYSENDSVHVILTEWYSQRTLGLTFVLGHIHTKGKTAGKLGYRMHSRKEHIQEAQHMLKLMDPRNHFYTLECPQAVSWGLCTTGVGFCYDTYGETGYTVFVLVSQCLIPFTFVWKEGKLVVNRIGTRGVDDTGTMVGSAKKLDQVPTPNALSETCISLLSLNTRRTFPVPYLNGSRPDGSFDSTLYWWRCNGFV